MAVGPRTGWTPCTGTTRAGDRIETGIRVLAKMPPSPAREKVLAWLLGFTAHVIMDVTVHPVVGLKVEPYEENKKAHCICEMNQDTYIFQTRMNLDIHYSSQLKAGICKCSDPADEDRIDPDIFYVWNEMFRGVDMALFTTKMPDINVWHDCFEDIVPYRGQPSRCPGAPHSPVDT